MSNRMSVLSRRLERFAVIFSIATFAFLLIGLYAAAKTEAQLVFLSAGLASVCLLAAFFLWLAHGFAWALIPEEQIRTKKPAEALRPVETLKAAEETRPVETMRPAEAAKPTEAMKAAEEKRPVETMKSAEAAKPADAMKAVEKKPAEEMIPEEDPPDAKYTITGKRIY
jgi:hypothetical protein